MISVDYLMLSLLLICIPTLSLVLIFYKRDDKSNLPPGPKPLPLIGNIHQLPKSSFLALLRRWHTAYGPIISIRLCNQMVVFLGSHHVAYELLGKKGAWFSSRPKVPFLDRVLRGPIPIGLPYGEEWKGYRRFQHSILKTEATNSYHKIHDLESIQVLREMLVSDDFDKALARYTYSLASTLNYGHRLPEQDNAELRERQGLMEDFFSELLSTSLLFDSIPFIGPYLNWAVGREDSGDRIAERIRASYSKSINTAMDDGNRQSWAQKMLHEASKHSRKLDQVYLESFEMHSAVTLSIQSSLRTLILAAVLHKDSVAVVQNELDSVIGRSRCPNFEDKAMLPHLNSFVKELLRWRPSLPIGVPRIATADSEYAGYRIPKGSIVMTSHSAINMDGEIYDRPELFQGDRFVKNPGLPDPASFGHGRRACPGRNLARDSLFIVASRLLWGYNIMPHPEDQIQDFDTVGSKTGFIFFRPNPFRAKFEVRSPEHQTTIEREFQCKSSQSDRL